MKKMKKQIITLTAIVAILVAAIFAGCVEKEAPVSTPTSITMPPPTSTLTPLPTQTPRPTPIVTPTPTPVLTYQDSEYTDWTISTLPSISLDLDLMTSASEMLDFEGVERYSGMLYDDAKKALDEIDQFDVSSALKPSKDEFKLALQDFKQAGYYGEKGARNYDSDDLETCSDYMKRGGIHSIRAGDLLP